MDNDFSKENLNFVLDLIPDAVFLASLSEDRLVEINRGFSTLTGFAREDVVGKTLVEASIWPDPGESLAARQMARHGMAVALDEGGSFGPAEVVIQGKDGSQRFVSLTARSVAVDGAAHILGICRDHTALKTLEETAKLQATLDGLTGVTNYRQFLTLAQAELKRCNRYQHPLALALLDIDRLTRINETHGQAFGDQVIQAFTRLCQTNSRGVDLFARYGGDVFVLLLPETTCERAYNVVERIRQIVAAQPVEVDGQKLAITISAGLACWMVEDETLDTLLVRADKMLSQAKEAGRNRVVVDLFTRF